jgi:hypothetical protein
MKKMRFVNTIMFFLAFCFYGTSCAVLDSTVINSKEASNVHSTAGSYSLAKQILRVTKSSTGQIDVAAVTEADSKADFKLGTRLSPLSDDDIEVDYVNDLPGGILDKIVTKTKDRTADILIQIAKTISYLHAGEITAGAQILAEYDPFEPSQVRMAGVVLNSQKVCIEVETSSSAWSSTCDPQSLERAGRVTSALPRAQTAGIFFRRSMLHVVKIKKDGQYIALRRIPFANDQPIQMLNVDRAFLVENSATIDFNNGELVSVHVVKPSEALALATLPLEIIKAVVAAPVDALSDHKKLQDAKADYYKSVAARIQAEGALPSNQSLDRAGPITDLRNGPINGYRDGGVNVSAERKMQLCADAGITNASDCDRHWEAQ